jgi:hypothetical protein
MAAKRTAGDDLDNNGYDKRARTTNDSNPTTVGNDDDEWETPSATTGMTTTQPSHNGGGGGGNGASSVTTSTSTTSTAASNDRARVGGFRGRKAPDGYARSNGMNVAAGSTSSGSNDNKDNLSTSLFVGGPQWNEQRRLLVSLVGMTSSEVERRVSNLKLPGPLPATLGRSHLSTTPRLNGHEYWVCEKSDGERAMLLANNKGVWLVDRKFDFRNMAPSWSVLSTLCTNGGMLLDGELVNGLDSKEKGAPPAGERYMVFDAVCINGDTSIGQQPHSKRRIAIETVLKGLPSLSPPILVKKFVKPSDLGYLFSKITLDSQYVITLTTLSVALFNICNERPSIVGVIGSIMVVNVV